MMHQLANNLYFLVMGLVVIGWLVLILFPRQSWANYWFSGIAVPLVLSFIYTIAVVAYWFQPPTGSLFQFLTLPTIYEMFGNRGLLLAGWIDLIAMDLVVGAWMSRKATQIRMPYIFLLPCLILTFVFAGVGFTLFAIVAAIGGGWGEMAKFEGQPPVNVWPVFARPLPSRPARG
jgi:ABA4-like protein